MLILTKRNILLHFKTTIIFFDFILQFWRSAIFWVELCIFFPSCLLFPTNSCFASLKAISDKDLKPYTSLNYWFQYCVQYCDLRWALVKCQRPSEECTKNLGDTFDCRHAYIRQKFSLFYYFSCLIGNPDNFEINRLTRLVVNGMFPLPYTTSLMRFSSF